MSKLVKKDMFENASMLNCHNTTKEHPPVLSQWRTFAHPTKKFQWNLQLLCSKGAAHTTLVSFFTSSREDESRRRSPSNKRTSAPSSHRSMPVGVRSVSSYAQGTTACCSFLTTFPDSGEETGALRNIGKTTNIPAWIWIYVSCHLSVYTPTSRRKKISACRLI